MDKKDKELQTQYNHDYTGHIEMLFIKCHKRNIAVFWFCEEPSIPRNANVLVEFLYEY